MWPHTRIAWWDLTRWLAQRARLVAFSVGFTLAASGIAAYECYGPRAAGPVLPDSPAPTQPPAVEPTVPWSAAGNPSASGPPATTPTFISPTQPWPGSTP